MLLLLVMTIALLAQNYTSQRDVQICSDNLYECLLQNKKHVTMPNSGNVILNVVNTNFEDQSRNTIYYTVQSKDDDFGGFFINQISEILLGKIVWKNFTMTIMNNNCENNGMNIENRAINKEKGDINGNKDPQPISSRFDLVDIEENGVKSPYNLLKTMKEEQRSMIQLGIIDRNFIANVTVRFIVTQPALQHMGCAKVTDYTSFMLAFANSIFTLNHIGIRYM